MDCARFGMAYWGFHEPDGLDLPDHSATNNSSRPPPPLYHRHTNIFYSILNSIYIYTVYVRMFGGRCIFLPSAQIVTKVKLKVIKSIFLLNLK